MLGRTSCQDFRASCRRPGGSLPPPWTPASLSLLPAERPRQLLANRLRTYTTPGSTIPLELCAKTVFLARKALVLSRQGITLMQYNHATFVRFATLAELDKTC